MNAARKALRLKNEAKRITLRRLTWRFTENEIAAMKRENRLLRYDIQEAVALLGKTTGPANMYGTEARADWQRRYHDLVKMYGRDE
jgi:hypothetical protein